MSQPIEKHVRRKRYKGTHPKTFLQKYKELQPEKYAETIAKVLQKGSTPAGMHRPICVDEIMEILQIKPGQIGLDCTLGYGGHTLVMLEQLKGVGHLYAIDVDPLELPRTQARLEQQGYSSDLLTIRQMNFASINQIVAEAGQLDFVVADLGVSSMQIDNPARGFTFKSTGPLDLRLNPRKGMSAAELLQTINQKDLEEILVNYADEPYAKIIAKAVVSTIKKGTVITTTTQLQQIIKSAVMSVPGWNNEIVKKSCQRCFQALRIAVNHELEVLDSLLDKLPGVLKTGGKVAILTFHSGEDRRVKKSFQQYLRDGVYSAIATEPIKATAAECETNSRARSAKLRWAIKA
jgi:16S rRNA (cytosine1402-N4)-methyltransferase